MELQTLSVLSILLIILQKTVFIQTYYVDNKMPVRHLNTQHRYPHLQKVIERIDSDSRHYVSSRITASTDTASVSSAILRTSDSHAKTHDEDYDDDHIDDDDEEEEDEDDEEEDEEEEESEGKTVKDHQSYQPHLDSRPPWESGRTTTSRIPPIRTTPRSTPSAHHHHEPPQPPQPPQPMSSYSQFKWSTFGRRPELDEFRNSRINTNYKKPAHNTDDSAKALEHAQRVNRDILCRMPRPKVIHVKDIHHDPSKTYVPHCTVLHQCGNDTGCCRSERQACLPTKEHRVELYFYSTSTIASGLSDVGSRYRQHHSTSGNVVKLVFFNHTECACQDRNTEKMPRDMESAPPLRHQFQLTTSPASSSALSATTTYRPHYYQQSLEHESPARSPSSSCRCPTEFYPRHLADGSCTCDCFDKQRDCLRYKKGKEYFTHQDKLCIERRVCHMPQCEYGSYLHVAGRCPTQRKQDKFSSWHRY